MKHVITIIPNSLRATFIVASLAVIITACGAPGAQEAAAPTPAPTAATSAVAEAESATIVRSKGDPNAPVKIIEYSDFQCPFCAQFEEQTMPYLEKNYIDTGKVYLEYRDFPLTTIHGSALLASHAANCAAKQNPNNYWPMHDRLFRGNSLSEWGDNVSIDFATFLGYARDLKLDDKALQACIQSNTFANLISSDFKAGNDAGVQSTPTFFVNGTALVGAQPYDVFEKAIQEELTKTAK